MKSPWASPNDSRIMQAPGGITCPDCGVGTIREADCCDECGLSYGALLDAAAFMEEIAEHQRTQVLEEPDRDGLDF